MALVASLYNKWFMKNHKFRRHIAENGVQNHEMGWDICSSPPWVPFYPYTMFQNPISRPSHRNCRKTIITQKVLVTQSSNIVHYDQHTQKPVCADLQAFANTFSLCKLMFFFSFFVRGSEILAVSWTPPDKKNWKKHQFAQGKSVCKGLQICTYRFLGMLIIMHYVRTLCDKYFLSYYGFSAFSMGRSRYRVLKHGVWVKWDPRRTAAYVLSHFMVLNPIFCYVSPKIVIFHELLIVETCNKCHWIQHALNPKYAPLKQFWCIFAVKINKMWNFCLKLWFFRNHLSQRLEIYNIGFSMPQTLNMWHSSNFNVFSQSKSTKCEILAVSLIPPDKKLKKMSIYTGKKFLQRLANLHI